MAIIIDTITALVLLKCIIKMLKSHYSRRLVVTLLFQKRQIYTWRWFYLQILYTLENLAVKIILDHVLKKTACFNAMLRIVTNLIGNIQHRIITLLSTCCHWYKHITINATGN